MKKMLFMVGLIVCMALCGCSNTEVSDNEITSISTSDKGWMKNLQDNTFYVVRDGTYYPLYTYYNNTTITDDGLAPDIESPVNTNRMMFFTSDNEAKIPTLYKGDKLMYYSKSSLLSYISWERYYDLGYTIGVADLQSDISGRMYINLDDNDLDNILPNTPLTKLASNSSAQILFDKIGGTQITQDMVDSGIIVGTEKDKMYDLDLYIGTNYEHYAVPANYHAFRAYELYASVNYTTLQDFLYEIEIPDYLLTGYYNIGGTGLVRYVTDKQYDQYTDFNEQLLYQSDGGDPDSEGYEYTYTPPYCYSEYAPLNLFKTDFVDAFGYVDPDITQSTEEDNKADEKKIIQESIKKDYTLYLPDKTDCKVSIQSPSGEKTGCITITYENGKTVTQKYNYVDEIYELSLKGNGETVKMTIEGYDVTLTNAEIKNGGE